MFRTIAEDIVFFLLRKGFLDNKKREIYEYGMEVLLLNGSLLCTTLIISLVMNKLYSYILFLLFFVPLRVTLGGGHLKTSGACMLCSNLMYVILVLVESGLYNKLGIMESILFFVVGIATILLKPIHKDLKGKRNKKIANTLIAIDFILCYAAFHINFQYESALMIFVLLPEILFIFGKMKWCLLKRESEK